jgi:hypothetical protein
MTKFFRYSESMKPSSNFARLSLSVFALAAATSSALAHPGHPVKGSTVAHFITSPYHLATLAGGGLLLLGAAWFIQRPVLRRAVQCSGVAALVAAAALLAISG